MLVRPNRMFPEREDIWEVADSGDFAAKIERHQPPVKSSGWAFMCQSGQLEPMSKKLPVRTRGNDSPSRASSVRRVAEGMP